MCLGLVDVCLENKLELEIIVPPTFFWGGVSTPQKLLLGEVCEARKGKNRIDAGTQR